MYLSARQASKILGVSNVTVALWCKEGRIPGAIQASSQWLIPAAITIDDIQRPAMGRPRKDKPNTGPHSDGGDVDVLQDV